MSGLQEAFYIIGIIYMAVMLLLILALVVVAFRIKSKVNKIHDNIEEKINSVAHLAEKGGELAAIAGGKVVKKAKKALNKK
jgi:H+/gluconate symporter-like permease